MGFKTILKLQEPPNLENKKKMNIEKKNVLWKTSLKRLVQNDPTLIELDLYKHHLGNAGVMILADALRANHTLKSLNLSENKIGNDGVEYLSLALKSNCTLQSLNLSNNNIGNEGAHTLADFLQTNQTLQILGLWKNNIDQGAEYFCTALESNRTLQSLNLERNPVDINLEKKLREMITDNQNPMVQQRQFIQKMVILGRDAANPNSLSLWAKLPKEFMLRIISLIDFRSTDSIEKSADQTYQCAEFIFNNIEELNNLLKAGTGLKIIEKRSDEKSSFRFFQSLPKPSSSRSVSVVEKNDTLSQEEGEPSNKIRKYN